MRDTSAAQHTHMVKYLFLGQRRPRIWIACLVALAVASGVVVDYSSQAGWSTAALAIIGSPSGERNTALLPQQDRLYGGPVRRWRSGDRAIGSPAHRRCWLPCIKSP